MWEYERRHTPRYPFDATAEILDEQEDSRTSCQVRDLSVGGCYVETDDPLPLGRDIRIEIYSGAEFLESRATVAFFEPKQGMGLSFSIMQPHFTSVLSKWLKRAEALAEPGQPEG